MSLDLIEMTGMNAEDLIVLMAALTAFVSSFAVWSALLYRDPAARRAELMATQREALRAGLVTSQRRKERDHSLTFMRQVVDRLQLMKSSQAEKITNNLARAGCVRRTRWCAISS